MFFTQDPDLKRFSDASLSGWGGGDGVIVYNMVTIRGP